jgi:hypothetical protein
MKLICVLTTALALACLVHPASASAEDVAPPPEITKWKPLVGHWVNEEEQRNSEDEPWVKASSEWDIRFAPGGFFVETPGKMTLPDGEVSWIQVWGYDPSKKAAFSHWHGSTGAQGHSTYQWHGRNVKLEGTDVMPDGSHLKIRCNWTNAEDYTSSELVFEQFTSGKWWVFRKAKATKVK